MNCKKVGLVSLEESKDSSNIEDSDDEYANLFESLKNCLEPGKSKGTDDDDENFCEKEEERVYAKYVIG